LVFLIWITCKIYHGTTCNSSVDINPPTSTVLALATIAFYIVYFVALAARSRIRSNFLLTNQA
jgi:hypothetical protein